MITKIQNSFLSQIKKTLLNDLAKDSDNQEIIKGAGTTFSLKIIGLAFSYIFNILFARLYGAEVMGLFALAITVAGIFSLFAQMGTQTSVVRFVAQYAGQDNYCTVKEIYKNTAQLVVPLSVIFAVLFYVSSPWIAKSIFHKPRLIVPLKITAFVVPFGVLMNVNTSALRGLKNIKDAFLFSTVLPPVLNTFGLMGLTYFVIRNYLTPIYVNLITAFIGAVFSSALWKKQSKRLPQGQHEKQQCMINRREIIKVSLPMLMTSAMLLIMGWTDTFMLGMFRSTGEVGVYQVALKLALFSSFMLGAVNSIAGPKFSELYWKGNKHELKLITEFSSKIIFWTSLPVFVFTMLFSKQILSIFGKEFIVGSVALIILSLGQFINASCGSVGLFLDMTGKQNVFRNIMFLGGMLNILLNLFLIPLYGIVGAALATALSTIAWNIITSIYVYKLYGYWVGYYPTLDKTL